jgi:hypothetical protein
MSGSGYRILGFAVWHGGKWYLRRKLPSPRTLALGGVLACAGLAAAAAIARRPTS